MVLGSSEVEDQAFSSMAQRVITGALKQQSDYFGVDRFSDCSTGLNQNGGIEKKKVCLPSESAGDIQDKNYQQ